MKLLNILLLLTVGVVFYILIFFPDTIVIGINYDNKYVGSCAGYPDGKCESNPNGALPKDVYKCSDGCTNPYRPYFDTWGNEFDYQGKLINAVPCTTDPISKEPNPYSCKYQAPNYQPFVGK